MYSDNGISVNIKNTVDAKEIQKFMDQAAVNILVGFPSGRQHVPTLHRNKETKKFEGYNREDPTEIDAIDTADLAKMLHFGTVDIPARPFLEDGIKQNLGKLKRAMQDQVKKIKEGGKANWNKVGTMAVGAISEFVRSDYYKQRKPNADRTKEYKGSDTPLIDGADMINSLVYLVDAGNGIGETMHVGTRNKAMNMEQYQAADFRSKK